MTRTSSINAGLPLHKRLRAKVALTLLLLIAGAVLAVALPLYYAMRWQIVGDMQRELSAIAATAALHIDGDAHRDLATMGGSEHPAFPVLREQLAEVRDELGLPQEHIYTFYRDQTDPTTVRFGVMTHPQPFTGDPYPLRERMLHTFDHGETVATDLYADEHGEWLSAYAPIRTDDGEVVALLEVDRRADMYLQRHRGAAWLAGSTGAVVLLSGITAGAMLFRRLVGVPVDRIHRGVAALAERDFSHRIGLKTGDELQHLADAIDDVAGQLDAARHVHTGLIPETLPCCCGWRLAGASVPCDATAGDYYDAFELPGKRIGVAIGDVTGHGLGPSLLMSSCRSALHAICQDHAGDTAGGAACRLEDAVRPPAEVLERLARVCGQDLSLGKFITLIYGVLEPDGTFTYANAGHGPTLARLGDGAQRLETHRPPLGIPWETPRDEPTQSTLKLAAGDRLLLTSDGVTEARGPNGMYEEHRLSDLLVADRGDAKTFVSKLLDAVRAHANGMRWDDDVTVLCIDRVG